MSSESELVQLSKPEHWNELYASKMTPDSNLAAYDWYRNFSNLKSFFEKYLPVEDKSGCHILHLGCGSSTLTADLHGLGYTNQTSVDFSEVVIEAMKSKYLSLDTRWLVLDVRSMPAIPTASVNVAIDKGTLDAFIHGSVWDPPVDVRENVGSYVDEVARVLKPGGQWLHISSQQPHFMQPLLEREGNWTLEVEKLDNASGGGSLTCYAFMMRRYGE